MEVNCSLAFAAVVVRRRSHCRKRACTAVCPCVSSFFVKSSVCCLSRALRAPRRGSESAPAGGGGRERGRARLINFVMEIPSCTAFGGVRRCAAVFGGGCVRVCARERSRSSVRHNNATKTFHSIINDLFDRLGRVMCTYRCVQVNKQRHDIRRYALGQNGTPRAERAQRSESEVTSVRRECVRAGATGTAGREKSVSFEWSRFIFLVFTLGWMDGVFRFRTQEQSRTQKIFLRGTVTRFAHWNEELKSPTCVRSGGAAAAAPTTEWKRRSISTQMHHFVQFLCALPPSSAFPTVRGILLRAPRLSNGNARCSRRAPSARRRRLWLWRMIYARDELTDDNLPSFHFTFNWIQSIRNYRYWSNCHECQHMQWNKTERSGKSDKKNWSPNDKLRLPIAIDFPPLRPSDGRTKHKNSIYHNNNNTRRKKRSFRFSFSFDTLRGTGNEGKLSWARIWEISWLIVHI